jgi:hypothetical protein
MYTTLLSLHSANNFFFILAIAMMCKRVEKRICWSISTVAIAGAVAALRTTTTTATA